MLNIAEGKPWSDGGWTKVTPKFKETQLATDRQATESPHDNEQCDAMKVKHHNGNVKAIVCVKAIIIGEERNSDLVGKLSRSIEETISSYLI